ncbi:MAG: tandem-95 repeat protein [Planctomycetia bacterium]|nr:tandem-95 repeat protein [Planctomycetia bacterium]
MFKVKGNRAASRSCRISSITKSYRPYVESLEERLLLANDLYRVPGVLGETVKLQFTLSSKTSTANNELGIYLVDDSLGRVNGILPNQTGYAQAAASRAQQLFADSATVGTRQEIVAEAGQQFGYLLVKRGSLQEWSESNPDNLPQQSPLLLFSFDGANPELRDAVRTKSLTADTTQVRWEDSLTAAGRLFNDQTFSIKPVRESVLQIPGQPGQTVATHFTLAARSAGYRNEAGFFLVDDASGSINGIMPGDAGYAQAALMSESRQVIFSKNSRVGTSRKVSLPSQSFVVFYMVQNSTTAEFLNKNPGNQRGQGPLAFFSLQQANPDLINHQIWFNFKSFGFEDIFGGGDRDFNDILVRFTMSNPQGPVVPPESNAPVISAALSQDTAPGGTTNNDTITFNPQVQGTVTDQSRITSFRAGLDSATLQQFVNLTSRLNSNGNFVIDRSLLNQLAGGVLSDGEHTLKLIASDQFNNTSAIYTVPFVLDSQIALTVDLAGDSDTPPVGDLKTSLSVINLTGQTDPGAVVELVGSAMTTIANSLGSYTLTGIGLSIGNNLFSIKATDIAGNERISNITIEHEPPGDCGFDDELTGWIVEELGGSLAGKGTVSVLGGSATIHEGDSYLVSLSKDFIVPTNGTARLSIEFSTPQFDSTAVARLRDAFEIAYVDATGNSLVLPFSITRDAYYNATEGLSPLLAAGVFESQGRLNVNLAGIAPGTTGRLYLRLFNNDGDTQSQVTIHCVRQEQDPGLTPPSATFSTATPPTPSPISVDISNLLNVSGSIHGVYGQSSYFANNDTAYSTLALKNIGSYGIGGPVLVVIDQLSDPTVVPQGIDGILPDGRGYYNFTSQLNDDKLEPGNTSQAKALRFYSPDNKPFTYQLTVLAQANRDPEFVSHALPDVMVGRTYRYAAQAVDPDGDTVSYQLIAGPVGMSLHPATGQVIWIPSLEQIGNHTVILQANDGRGGLATQQFTIAVRETIPNRPPIITSTPVVDAYVNNIGAPSNLQYRYDVKGFDPDFDPTSFSLTIFPAGMTINASTGVITWTPTGLQLGDHAVKVKLSDGRGGEAEQSFTVTVHNPNDNNVPLFVSVPPTQVVSGQTLRYDSLAIDPDEDAISYSVVNGPAGLVIHPETGIVTWNTSGAIIGNHLITLKASDGKGGEALQTFTVNVQAGPGGTISGRKLQEGVIEFAVPATSHPWLAGMPNETVTVTGDSAPAQSPTLAGISVTPGQVLNFLSVGSTSVEPNTSYTPDGTRGYFLAIGEENGISTVIAPYASVLAVFLGDDRPDQTPAPELLMFNDDGNVPGGINYTSLSPLLKQVFFIGDGRTNTGVTQQITVPAGATRLFIGIADNPSYANNNGNLSVLVSAGQMIAPILLNETEFSPANWTFAQGPIHDGNPSLSGPNAVTIEHRTTGGNPGATQYIREFMRVGDFISTIGSSNNLIYTPQTQGAIHSIDASVDLMQNHVEEPGQYPAGTVWKIMIEQNGVRYYDKQLRVGLNNFDEWKTFTASGLRETDFDTNVMVGFTGGTIPSEPDGQHPDFSANAAPMTFGFVDCNAGGGPQGAPLSTAVLIDNLNIIINRQTPTTGLSSWVVYLDQNNNGVRDPGEQYQVTDGQGNYQFSNLPSGQYIVREDAQPIASQSYLYSDGEFAPAHWQDSTVFLRDGNPSLSGPLVVGPSLRTTGGNPANYRYQADDFRVGDWIATASINSTAIYDPQVQGALASVDFSMDVIQFPPVLPGQGPGGTAFVIALRQNGQLYFGTPFGNGSTTWRNYTTNGMTAEDFDIAIVPEERLGNHPDFSANGAPIEFGYGHWINGFGTPGFRLLNEFGVDNWAVTVQNIGQTGLWEQVSPSNPSFHSVDLAAGATATGMDFINRRLADAGPEFTSEPIRTAQVNELYLYNVEAIGSGGITYDLPQRPAGMAIDPVTGLLAWRPGEVQEGMQSVVIRIRDGQGRIALQSFSIDVSPGNTAPAFISNPVLQAALNRPWQYRAQAVDADNDPLTFALVNGPTGLTVSSSGWVTWTPSAGQLGTHQVQLRVSDGQGAEAFQQFTLSVAASVPNSDPVLTGTPRTQVRIGDQYFTQFTGWDAEGDPLHYSLPSAPAGMSINNEGQITFIPDAGQFGSHSVTVRVEDGQGGSAEKSFVLNVVGQEVNHAPVITSTAPSAATVNRTLRYAPSFTDADGDPVIWSLVSAPAGMGIDPITGTILWRPAVNQLGTHTVVLQAIDPKLASTTQTFSIVVRGNNTPPVILSSAITEAAIQQDYEYRVQAQDAEGDQLVYSLTTAPAGMVINPDSGIITWTPASGQTGNHSVQVTVADEQGGQAVQNFTVVVSATGFNRSPVITSTPLLKASFNRLYSYQVEAVDPENDAITFALLSGPSGISINSTTGLLTWTPTPAQFGSHLVTVGARDSSGVYGQQTYRISVIENQAPVITSSPKTTGTSGTLYLYDVLASDPDGDTLTYSLTQFQAGMTIDAQGRVRWMVPQAQGSVDIGITITDGRGGVTNQTYQLTVTGDTQAPQVSVSVDPNPAVIGNAVLMRVNATDNDRIASLQLRLNGTIIPLAADGTAMVDAVAAGNFPIEAIATDAAGNQGVFTTNLVVVDEDDPTGEGPDIVISSPSDNANVSSVADLIGSISSASGVSFWTVSIAPYGGTEFRQLASGTGAVTNDVLAVIDPTLLANDQYIVRVIARDSLNRSSKIDVAINVQGELKLGRFRQEFIDLTIPLAGIPIEIRRVYDTLNSGIQGDFGYGWSLSIADPRIRETVPQNIGNGFFGPEAAPFKEGTKVYLTTPNGKRVGFTLAMDAISVPFFGIFYRPRFVADPGVFEKLDVLTQPGNAFGDLYVKLPDDTFTLPMAIFGGRFNPDSYNLTMTDGTIYRYNQHTGLREVVDPNGNTLTFGADGITSSLGVSIQFLRDARGRIAEIIDPSGKSLRYTYDAAGNLVNYSDQLHQQTQYQYLASPAHYISRLIDPRGNTALEMQYDPITGRATGLVDASGLPVISTFDVETMTESFMDRRGNTTTVRYDAQGNMTEIIDADGGRTLNIYDNRSLLLSTTDANNHTTLYSYDERGNRTSVTDALGNHTQLEYDLGNNLIRRTDALGQFLTFVYDNHGRLITRIDQRGVLYTTEYDSSGRIIARTDAACCGGERREYEYDQPFNQPTRVIYANGAVEQYSYDSNGLLVQFTDGNQLITEFTYNDAGLPVSITNSAGQLTRYTYDANGNIASLTDPLNQRTEFQYDTLDRLIAVIDPNQQLTRYEYDANHNRSAVIDRNGNRISFEYDRMNRQIQETWWTNNAVHRNIYTTYDAIGNRLSIFDTDAYLQFEYDALNRMVRADDGSLNGKPQTILQYTYDAVGNRISTSDNRGVVVDALFTPSRKVEQLQWQGGGINAVRMDFEYDSTDRVRHINRYAQLLATQPISSTQFTRDSVGNLTGITNRNATDAVLSSYTYGYDAGRRLVSSMINGIQTNYSYNSIGELGSADRSIGQDESYTFDSNGNRVQSHLHGTYSTGSNNQVLSDGVYSYTYDLEGQLQTKTTLANGDVTTYSYDHRHRLIDVTTRSAGNIILSTVTYRYDALDRRFAQINNGTTVFTSFNDLNVWADYAADGQVLARYLTGSELDQMLARYRPGTGVVWYLSDSLGSVRDMVSSDGTLLNRITYDSFGNVLSQTNPSASDRFLFTGREYNADTGLYYYRARFYNPQLGRFISQDPIKFKGGDANLYRYVGNNPLSFTDPTGLTATVEYSNIQKLKALEAHYLRRQIINGKQAACLLRFGFGIGGDLLGLPSLPGQTYAEFIICMQQAWIVP